MFPKNLANLMNFLFKNIYFDACACLVLAKQSFFCPQKNANGASKLRLLLLLLLDHHDSNKLIVIKCLKVGV